MLARGLGAGKSQDLSTAPGLIRFASAVRVNIFQNISGLSLGPDSAEFEEGLCSLRSDGKELKGLLLGEDGIQEDPPPSPPPEHCGQLGPHGRRPHPPASRPAAPARLPLF